VDGGLVDVFFLDLGWMFQEFWLDVGAGFFDIWVGVYWCIYFYGLWLWE